jgi:leucyl-tRNA---protein transferase
MYKNDLVKFVAPQNIRGLYLDAYLREGWFRNSSGMHQSKVLCLDNSISSIVNIRLVLSEFKLSKSIRKVVTRVQERFQVVVRPFEYSEEKETLYQEQTPKFKGYIMESLAEYLNISFENVFDTYEVCVYDGENLIAFSLFDLGTYSVAGIFAAIKSEYSNYSLGYYTMYKEIEWSIMNQKQFYYPGYILSNNPAFDYKTRFRPIQYLQHTGEWVYEELSSENDLPAEFIQKKTHEAVELLRRDNLDFELAPYPFYSFSYINADNNFVRSALLILFRVDKHVFVLEYLYEDEQYQFSIIQKVKNEGLFKINKEDFDKATQASSLFMVLSYKWKFKKCDTAQEAVEQVKRCLKNI